MRGALKGRKPHLRCVTSIPCALMPRSGRWCRETRLTAWRAGTMLTAVSGTADHVPRNRAAWDRWAERYTVGSSANIASRGRKLTGKPVTESNLSLRALRAKSRPETLGRRCGLARMEVSEVVVLRGPSWPGSRAACRPAGVGSGRHASLPGPRRGVAHKRHERHESLELGVPAMVQAPEVFGDE